MQTLTQLDPLRRALAGLRVRGPVALVPTMGALHEGHLTLVREARRHAASMWPCRSSSIRASSAQARTWAAYPRQLAADSALLEHEGVAGLGPGGGGDVSRRLCHQRSVSGVSDGLCGAARPGHFDGVATVVCKLFNQVAPTWPSSAKRTGSSSP
jgi:pantoate--beta-alanine ligase